MTTVAPIPTTKGLTYTDELVTPDKAKRYLANAAPNRNVRPQLVERYVADMQAGRWVFTADAIRFNKDGELIDGQHRLLACVEAGKSFRSLTVRGLDNSVMPQIDTGAKRSLADVLRLRGDTNVNQVAAAIVTDWRWEQGAPQQSSLHPTIAESLLWLDEHPDLREATRRAGFARSSPLRFPIGPTAAVIRRIAAKHDPEQVEKFLLALQFGADVADDDPRFRLRAWALGVNANSQVLSKPPAYFYHAMLIKAWNYWIAGKKVKLLTWKPSVEDFPALQGELA